MSKKKLQKTKKKKLGKSSQTGTKNVNLKIPKGKIINAVRRIFWHSDYHKVIKDGAKIDAALFKCDKCDCYIYEGKSTKNYDMFADKYKDITVVKEIGNVDHIEPVIPVQKGWSWDWNDFMLRSFCEVSNLQYLCKSCHNEKTLLENKLRKEL